MARRRWTDAQLVEAVAEGKTIAAVLRRLGLATEGGNYKSVHKHITRLALDVSHMVGRSWLKGQSHSYRRPLKIPTAKILVKNSTYTSSRLRERLIREGLLAPKCAECGITDWHGKPLTLHLDHVNGDNRDNRIRNLRLLCPNCHSQTSTYCGRNRKPSLAPAKPTCKDCGADVSRPGLRCKRCAARGRSTKIAWPSNRELQSMVAASSKSAVGRRLGVSATAVRKRLVRR